MTEPSARITKFSAKISFRTNTGCSSTSEISTDRATPEICVMAVIEDLVIAAHAYGFLEQVKADFARSVARVSQ